MFCSDWDGDKENKAKYLHTYIGAILTATIPRDNPRYDARCKVVERLGRGSF